jgi:hypothetical protein
MANLLTRGMIMEYWKQGSDETIGSLCCPDCRDILVTHKDVARGDVSAAEGLVCPNHMCLNTNLYSATTNDGVYHPIVGKSGAKS